MIGLFKEFLQNIFQTIERYSSSKDWMILPRDILALPQDQLTSLIDFGLIKKYKYPRKVWCNNCDIFCEVEFANNKEFLICLECCSQEKINSTNSVQYYSGLTEISQFLQNILGLDNQVEIVKEGRLLYLGFKGKIKYYFLNGISQSDCLEIIQNISNTQHSCILVLENNHNLKAPQTLLICNILDFLCFEDTKFVLALPEITYTNSISTLGGKAKSDKYSKARKFIIAEFKKSLKAKYPRSQSLKVTYSNIADKLRKKPDVIKNLADDNLEDFVRKTISSYKTKNYIHISPNNT